jgi:hypothetical protein
MSQNPPQAPHTDAILFGAEEQLRDVQVFDTMTEATRIQRSRPRVDPIPATRCADDKNLKIKVAKKKEGSNQTAGFVWISIGDSRPPNFLSVADNPARQTNSSWVADSLNLSLHFAYSTTHQVVCGFSKFDI